MYKDLHVPDRNLIGTFPKLRLSEETPKRAHFPEMLKVLEKAGAVRTTRPVGRNRLSSKEGYAIAVFPTLRS